MLLLEGKNSARIMEEKGNHIRFTILSSLSSFLFHKICFYSDISLNGFLIRNLLVVNFLHDYSIFESRFDHFARISQLVVQTNQLSRMYRFHFRGLGININLVRPFCYLFCIPFLEPGFQNAKALRYIRNIVLVRCSRYVCVVCAEKT